MPTALGWARDEFRTNVQPIDVLRQFHPSVRASPCADEQQQHVEHMASEKLAVTDTACIRPILLQIALCHLYRASKPLK